MLKDNRDDDDLTVRRQDDKGVSDRTVVACLLHPLTWTKRRKEQPFTPITYIP